MTTKTSYVGSLSPEYALLGLLSQQAAHGYELHQRLKKELGEVWHISLSQTYNILNRLENQGFAASSLQQQEKLPARRTFTLTSAGHQRFDKWLRSPGGCSVRSVRVEFITRLYFAREIDPHLAGDIIESPKGLKSSKETGFHLAAYNLKPEIGGIAHVHPPYATAYANKASSLPLATISAQVILKHVPCIECFPPGSLELRDCVIEGIKQNPGRS